MHWHVSCGVMTLFESRPPTKPLVHQLFFKTLQAFRKALCNVCPALASAAVQETPLIRAAHNGHLSVVKFLLHSGADVNAIDLVRTCMAFLTRPDA